MKTFVAAAGFVLGAMMLSGADAPRKSPEFAARLPQGGQMLLSEYRGKVVCLEFLYTTCPHCQAATRLLNELYDQYGAKGFQPLGVALNDANPQIVSQYIRDFGAKYPIGYASRESVTTYLGLTPETRLSVPLMVFIDRKGMIRQQSSPSPDDKVATPENVRAMVEKLVNEPAFTGSKKRMPVPKKTM